MAIKGDIQKAYDRVEWNFLLAVLRNFSFDARWVGLISQWIVEFSILLNGSPFGHFPASRGLGQGDPLSPFLFILVFEVLSHILLRVEGEGSIGGLQLNNSAPKISHLLMQMTSCCSVKPLGLKLLISMHVWRNICCGRGSSLTGRSPQFILAKISRRNMLLLWLSFLICGGSLL